MEKTELDESRPEPRENTGNENSDEPAYLSGIKLFLVMVAISLNTFMVSMDQTVIATAIPSITDQFGSVEDIGWYASAYLLTSCLFQLLWGRIYTHFPLQHCLLVAMIIFLAGSTLCGAAPNSSSLVAGRAVAGIGAAGLLGGSGLVVMRSVPMRYRGLLDSVIGAIYGISGVVAPLIGGALTTKTTWRWCFYINLPVGGLALVTTKLFVHFPSHHKLDSLKLKDKLKYFDILGVFTVTVSVVCMVLGLQYGGNTYPWSNGRVIALFILSGVFMIIWVASQTWKKEYALLPMRILRQRSMRSSFLFILACSSSLVINEYYLPIYFQTSKSASALSSGLMLIPTIISYVLAALVAGAAVTAIGYYAPFMIIGSVLFPIGNGLLTTLTWSTPESKWIGYQILLGAGAGLGAQASMLPAQTVLDSEDVALGLSLLNFATVFSGAIFTSVANSIYTNSLSSGFSRAHIDAKITSNDGGLTSVSGNLTGTALDESRTVYDTSISRVFYLSTALSCVSILGAVCVEWISVKEDKKEKEEQPTSPSTKELSA